MCYNCVQNTKLKVVHDGNFRHLINGYIAISSLRSARVAASREVDGGLDLLD